MSAAQLELWVCKVAANAGRGLGVVVGCLIGMLPLLFIDTSQEVGVGIIYLIFLNNVPLFFHRIPKMTLPKKLKSEKKVEKFQKRKQSIGLIVDYHE